MARVFRIYNSIRCRFLEESLGGAPPASSPSLDFSKASNSMYLL